MSEPEQSRPRRGLPADDDATGAPSPDEDLLGDAGGAPRRGLVSNADVQPAAPVPPANPFARPGSSSASQPATVGSAPDLLAQPALIAYEDNSDEPTEGRRMSGVADGPRPAPRRSAVSSMTPPEQDPLIPAPRATAPGSGGTTASGATWLAHHRRTLLTWAVGALVAALLLAFGVFLFQRGQTPPAGPTPDAPMASSPSASASEVPDATAEDLMTLEDVALVVPDASWAVTNTVTERSEARAKPACLSSEISDVNPTISLQRTFGTSQSDQLAALHQIDVYASDSAAQQVTAEHVRALANCDEVPARIISASAVTGLADEVHQMTIAYENDPIEYHTILISRTGRAVTVADVVRHGEAVPPAQVAPALARSAGELCDRVEGTCPSEPAVSGALPLPAQPAGWLVTADLPRLTLGTGQWTATEPAPLTATGMGCEDLPLATEPGPSERLQRTFLMTQDSAAPETFGLDELLFTFEDPAAADAFGTKLSDSLANCKDRLLTATVTEHEAVSGTGADDVTVSARVFTIQQATSETSSVLYQLAVVKAGDQVAYLLGTVDEEYKFSEAQLRELALRAAHRATQD